MPPGMDRVITLDSDGDEDDLEIVEERKISHPHPEKQISYLDPENKIAKEQLEEIVKKRLEEVGSDLFFKSF